MSKIPFDFHWKHGEFEVRTTTRINGDPYVELVKWYESKSDGRQYCYTIAYWTYNDEGWDLRFVGDRMLDLQQLDIGKIWPQLCAAQICFDEWLQQKDKGEELW